jgi:hypothetical protein
MRYSRNTAEKKSSTSKHVDTVNISFGRGNKDETVLPLVIRLGFCDTPTLLFGSVDAQPAETVYLYCDTLKFLTTAIRKDFLLLSAGNKVGKTVLNGKQRSVSVEMRSVFLWVYSVHWVI